MIQPSESAPNHSSELSKPQAGTTSAETTPDPSTEPGASESQASPALLPEESAAQPPEPSPSYVKLAMRNMVKKGSKSLFHFTLTTAGLIALFVGLAYLTR